MHGGTVACWWDVDIEKKVFELAELDDKPDIITYRAAVMG
jgi:hypothetical protein